jgi:hypothetical protein
MKFKSGQIVTISNKNLHYSPDGFVTCPVEKNGKMRVYEKINLMTYPSCNDFLGKSTLIKDGDVATICKMIGRPERIKRNNEFTHYDVYEVLIHGKIRQVFKHNLFLFS